MSDEQKDNAEPKKMSIVKKVWFGFLAFFYLILSLLLLLSMRNFTGSHYSPDSPGILGMIGFVTMGALFSAGFYVHQLVSLSARSGKYRKIGTGIAIFIVFAFIAVWVPQFSSYKARNYPSVTKSNLHNIYLACKAYWADSGSDKNCSVDIARLTTYGYIQSKNVSVSGSGTETTFTAKSRHAKGTKTFTMNSIGAITEVDGK